MELRYKAHRKASTQLKAAEMRASETSQSGGGVSTSTETLIKPTYSRRRRRSKLELNPTALDFMDELDEKQNKKGKSKKAKTSGGTAGLQLVVKHGPIVLPEPAPAASSSETGEGPVVFPKTCEDCDGNMSVVIVDYNIIRHNYMETAICTNEQCCYVYPHLRVGHYYLPKGMRPKTEAEEDEEAAEEEPTGFDSIAEFEAGCDELERSLNDMEKNACRPIRVSASTAAIDACLPFAQDKAPAQLETCFPNGIPVLPPYAFFEQE